MLRYLWGELFSKGRRKMLKPKDNAPAWEAPDQDGRPVRSRDLAGKRYVLWFYPKAATPG